MPMENDLLIPSTDSPPGGVGLVYPCAHCLLLAKGESHYHSILAVAQPGRIPQHAWFNLSWLPILCGARPLPGELQGSNFLGSFSSWEVTSKWAKLKVSRPALNQDTFVWRFTDRTHANQWLLGVWAD